MNLDQGDIPIYKKDHGRQLIHKEKYSTRSEAMKRERFLKSGQGREWIKDDILK
jgi:predicted GIY-YIG superfamily endonuclease